ncbi:MAG TPA: alpha/beta hydrolase-fold protein [Terriglobales bacterium]|nr:alpha/beta hydrolase-fold protein [Terriglobales bacterium]
MRGRIFFFLQVILLLAASAQAQQPVRFQISVAPEVADKAVSGRLLVFMTQSAADGKLLAPDLMNPSRVWVEAVEVHDLEPGTPIEVAPTLSFPKPFAQASVGDYRFMALLDVNHNYSYKTRADGGDLHSDVIEQHGFDPAKPAAVALTLSKRVAGQEFKDTVSQKLVSMESRVLSKFWGRPITVEAVVLLPPSYSKEPSRRYPAVYEIHGYQGNYLDSAHYRGREIAAAMSSGKTPEMIYVFLNGECPLGHHEFADSVNNGPWGEALTREFIPYLEKKFRMDGVPRGRLLTGHSSGGWSSLWLEINYPDVFGGTWSTSPDPEDFRSFTDIDLLKGDNFYYDAGGKERNLFRFHGKEIMSMKEFVQLEQVLGDYGGQMQSFDAVFSPRGEDGRPMQVFDHQTGKVNPEVVKAWEERYDVSTYLRKNWKQIGPKLKGKIRVWVGSVDNFHLEGSARLLEQTLKELDAGAKVTYLEGRDHFDLYRGGLAEEIAKEMYAVVRAKQSPAVSRQSPAPAANRVGGADTR